MLPAYNGASNIYGSGMLSLGMAFSLEQLLIDNDLIGMIKFSQERGIEVNDSTLAYDTIVDVGIGHDFLSTPDTLANVDNPSQPVVLDRRMRPDWEVDGEKDTADIAHEKVVEILENFEVEPLSDYAIKRMDEIIADVEERMKNGEF